MIREKYGKSFQWKFNSRLRLELNSASSWKSNVQMILDNIREFKRMVSIPGRNRIWIPIAERNPASLSLFFFRVRLCVRLAKEAHGNAAGGRCRQTGR